MRKLAARLIAGEAKGKGSPQGSSPAVSRVCEKLRPHLATLMGKAGFRAVLARALAVTSAEVPWLATLHVNTDGALEGWDNVEPSATSKVLTESGVLLVAQLLGLLVAFIGENLTLRLVRDVWPQLSLEDLQSPDGNPL